MNILILSAGTRNLLISYFLESGFQKVVAADASPMAPALYAASQYYIIPRMTDPGYLEEIERICLEEEINAILPLQEDELEIISTQADRFSEKGIRVIVSDIDTLKVCRDKYAFYCRLRGNDIPVLDTFCEFRELREALNDRRIDLPVFLKPRNGCGSSHSFIAKSVSFIRAVMDNYPEDFVIQRLNRGKEYGADIYCDWISGKVTHIFVKEKIRMRAGETEKSVSINSPQIFELIRRTMACFSCSGPVDMDIFDMDGKLYVSEINPRFGGGYPHAFRCGVSFPKYIRNNLMGEANQEEIGAYDAGVVALKTQDIILLQDWEKLDGDDR